MKKLTAFVLIILAANCALAQSDTAIKSGWGNLDYSIPESPAFKILGTTPDNILKPASVRNIALSVGNYFLTSGSVIPRNFAVEISPALLNNKVSLNSYNKNKFWYRFRFSIGTNVLDNGSYSVAEGLRFTLVDKTDLRDASNNPNFYNFMYDAAIDKSRATDLAIAEYLRGHSELTNVEAGEKFATDTAFKNLINNNAKKFYNQSINIDKVSSYRDSVRNLMWNAAIAELGIATLQSSTDSLIKNLKFSQVAAWFSAAFPLGKNGQILIGVKGGMIDSIDWKSTASAGARIYYGSNNVKGFLQAEYNHNNKMNSGTAGFGCQFNIANGLWGQFSINLVIDEKGKLSYNPGFDIGFGTPEKKKL